MKAFLVPCDLDHVREGDDDTTILIRRDVMLGAAITDMNEVFNFIFRDSWPEYRIAFAQRLLRYMPKAEREQVLHP